MFYENPMGKNRNNSASKIQEVFLNHCRRNKIKVHVDGDGSELTGYIVGFDPNSIIIDCGETQMMLYKAKIYSIRPLEKVNCIFNENFQKKHEEPVIKGVGFSLSQF